MPLASYDEYVQALGRNIVADYTMSSTVAAGARLGDCTTRFLPLAATPAASVALNKASDRAINTFVPDPVSGRLSVLGGRVNPGGTAGCAMILVDLLAVSGGLSAAATGDQTLNLPTPALPRYATGEGVHAAVVVFSGIGATATTMTATYTNQAGVGGRVTPAVQVGGSGFALIGAAFRLPLQPGDTGIRSVESINLAASTGAAGNMGVVLYRPIAMMMANDVEGPTLIDIASGRMVGGLAQVLPGACLSMFTVMAVTQPVSGTVILGEV